MKDTFISSSTDYELLLNSQVRKLLKERNQLFKALDKITLEARINDGRVSYHTIGEAEETIKKVQ